MRYCPLCKSNLETVTIENNNKLKCSKCYFTFWNNPSPVTASILLYNNLFLWIEAKLISAPATRSEPNFFDKWSVKYPVLQPISNIMPLSAFSSK